MSTLKFEYRDENWDLVDDRAKAVYDPHGRRMDECLNPDCHNKPKHYLVDYEGFVCHTRFCDEHRWKESVAREFNLRPDPEMEAA